MNYIKLITVYSLAILYVSVGITHFTNPDFFIPLVPPSLIFLKELVLISGFIEVVMGVMLFFKSSRKLGAIVTIILLLAVFPANIYLYLSENPQNILGISKNQALFRLPFQVPLIIIAYWHSMEKSSKRFSLFCCTIFIPTIIYFISL
tara:strand:+ start:613 stop:1056 length:444 start_codon:yes stop_codon:yes gene_type:complete